MAWADIPGAFDFMALYDDAIARAKDGDVLVEVGVMLGRSVAYLARKAKDSGKKLTIYGVDSWDAATWDEHYWGGVCNHGGPFNTALHNLRTHAPQELEAIHLLRCDSAQAARLFDDDSVHFAFIDGLHTYDAVKRDIAAWLPKIKAHGILAGHDHTISYEGVERACREAFPGGYEVVTAPPGGQDSWRVRLDPGGS